MYAKYNRNPLTASEDEKLADGLGWPYVLHAKRAWKPANFMWKRRRNKIKMKQEGIVLIWMENGIIKRGDRVSII